MASKHSQKYINERYIYELSQLYRVSPDYIKGESSDPKCNKDGTPHRFPIIDNTPKMISDVTVFLQKHNTFLQNICFIINLPEDSQRDLLNGFNSFISLLKINTFFSRKDGLSPESLTFIQDALTLNDLVTTDRLQKYATFLNSNGNDYSTMLSATLSLIITPRGIGEQNLMMHTNAWKQLSVLSKDSRFPIGLANYLKEFESYAINGEALSNECKLAVEEYFSENRDAH